MSNAGHNKNTSNRIYGNESLVNINKSTLGVFLPRLVVLFWFYYTVGQLVLLCKTQWGSVVGFDYCGTWI